MANAGVCALLLGLTACGRVGFTQPMDAHPLDAGDATPDACTFGPWSSSPTRVSTLATPAADYGPALRSDGSVLVFTSTRTGGLGNEDLYTAVQTAPLQFQAATNLAAFNSSSNDYGGAWAGLDELYFSSEMSGSARIYSASFDGTSFGAPALLSELVGADIRAVSVTGDGLEMFFANSAQTSLGRATRASRTASWTVVETTMPVVDTGGGAYPSIARNGLELYFQSARTGPVRIFVATRPDRQSPFGPPSWWTSAETGTIKTPRSPRMVGRCSSVRRAAAEAAALTSTPQRVRVCKSRRGVSTWPLGLRRTAPWVSRRVLRSGPRLAQVRSMLAAVETTLAFLIIAGCLLRPLSLVEKS